MLVQTANAYASVLRIGREGSELVNGKSIMAVMMLAAECGTTLVVECEGPDAEEQLRAIQELVRGNFGEAG
jgi:phosphocarrier protein